MLSYYHCVARKLFDSRSRRCPLQRGIVTILARGTVGLTKMLSVSAFSGGMQFLAAAGAHKEDPEIVQKATEIKSKFIPPELVSELHM